MQQHKFLRLPEVKARTGKSKTTIYRDIKRGIFPRQIQNGIGSVAWLESDIHKWQEEMMNQTASQNSSNSHGFATTN